MLVDAKTDKCKEMRHWLLQKGAHFQIAETESEVEADMYTTCKTAYQAKKNFIRRLADMYQYPRCYIDIFMDEIVCTGNARKERRS
mgnify:FL=1|jgi:hypothetical protein